MFKMIKIAALSTLLGLGAFAMAPASAQAGSLTIGVSSHGVVFGHGPGWSHAGWQRHACTPQRAVSKARRLGIRHARVRNVHRRTIRVSGQRHGRHVNVTFSRASGCPVIRW
jgi:hypothetical protein